MKKFASVSIALVLVISSITAAQDTSKNTANAKGHRVSARKVTISGRVSDDGKTLVSEGNTPWVVSNVNALNGHEGQPVTVKCLLYPEENQIHILTVQAAPGEVKYTTNWRDSAFRR